MRHWCTILLLLACGSEQGTTGDSCEDNLDCENICIKKLSDPFEVVMDLNWPYGYCTKPCMRHSDCLVGESCLSHSAHKDETGHCYQECWKDYECRIEDGYSCKNLTTLDSTMYCLPEFEEI